MMRRTPASLVLIMVLLASGRGCSTAPTNAGATAGPTARQEASAAARSPADTPAASPAKAARPSEPVSLTPTEPAVELAPTVAAKESVDASAPRVATPYQGVTVHVNGQQVEIDAIVCIEAGWLEFIACSPNTKEHESLVVVEQRPSDLHAALLLAGFDAGRPGRWTYTNEQFELVPPSGSKLRIDVRYTDASGTQQEHSICQWIHDHLGRHAFPCEPWVFGGSQFAANPPDVGGEHYVADMTGSVIGLATFGDEMIGYSTVISHDSNVQAPEWEAHTTALPAVGTRVTLIIREADETNR